jgi:hypothetical protein
MQIHEHLRTGGPQQELEVTYISARLSKYNGLVHISGMG